MRVIEKVKVGKRGDGTLIRVEGQANWYSVICVRGKQHEMSTGTPDLKLAKRFHRQKLDELAADRQGLKQFTTPQHRQLQFGSLLDDLVSDYRVRRLKSLASVLSHLKPLREHFGDWRAVGITFRNWSELVPTFCALTCPMLSISMRRAAIAYLVRFIVICLAQLIMTNLP